MDTPWYIELLGGLQARLPDRTLSRFQTRQAALLLAFLALHSQRPQPRDALADLLWPLADPASARNRLKVALASLRHQLEPPGVPPGAVLIASRSALQLNPAAATSDVARFEAALQAAARARGDVERGDRLREGVALYQGELLAGYEEAWVLPERERLAAAFLEALGELARLAERAGERGEALRWARQAVGADPVREEGQRELIRLLLAAGEREAARRQYEAFVRLLAAELGAAPEPQTRALIEGAPRQTRPVPAEPSAAGRAPGGRGAAPLPSPPLPAATPPAPEPPVLPAAPAGGAAAGATPHLPLQFTRFFGRDAELQLLGKLLRSEPGRLVTVMGPGGSGKTRLAVEAAGRLAGDWGGRVWFVSLAEVAEAARLPEAFREGMGLPPSPHLPALEQVASVLGSGPALLLLDNVEHLLPEGAGLLQGLRARLPGLTCLVTSRRRLGLEGERVLLLAPLPVPAAPAVPRSEFPGLDEPIADAEHGTWNPERLCAYPSVALFVDRAQGVRPDFQVTARNGAAVASLCRRLEGIPLSLELAAARAGVLTLRQMLEHLEEAGTRSVLLTRRGRGAEGRHASLGTALAWSYRLLEEPVQRFFARLSVFRGGWRWEAAAAVCEEERGLEYLEELRECSLVMGEESGERMRFRMLEPVREFGAEQLRAAEGEALARRHAGHFLALAEEAEVHLTRAEQVEWLSLLATEHENMRAAMRWAIARGEAEISLRLGAALAQFWVLGGHWSEGRNWLSEALALPAETAPTLPRARALYGAGVLATSCGDFPIARALFEESLSLFRDQPDAPGVADTLEALGHLARERGDYAAARALHEELLATHRRRGPPAAVARALHSLGLLTYEQGDFVRTRSLWRESLDIRRRLQDHSAVAHSLVALGMLDREAGDYEGALSLFEEALAIERQLDARGRLGGVLQNLAFLAYCQGDHEAARRYGEESLARHQEVGSKPGASEALYILAKNALGEGHLARAQALQEKSLAIRRDLDDRRGMAMCLKCLAEIACRCGATGKALVLVGESLALWQELGNPPWAAAACLELEAEIVIQGDPRRAARLLGAADALRDRIGSPRHARDQRAQYEACTAAARAALGEEVFAATWTAGRSLSLEEALAEALEGVADKAP